MMLIETLKAEFEERYAAVTSPVPQRPLGLKRSEFTELIENKSSLEVTACIQNVARRNDIESLKMILDHGLQLSTWPINAFGMLDADHYLHVTYAVAHMLVDGSGNEAFANRWLEHFNHSRSGAAHHFCRMNRRPISEVIDEQGLLGVAMLAKVFTLAETREGPISPFESVFNYRHGEVDHCLMEARELGYILRFCHPQGLPKVQIMSGESETEAVPLASFMMSRNITKFKHLLPAIEMAYGVDNIEVRSSMQSEIGFMLRQRKLSIEPFENAGYQWDAMQKWGEETLGMRVWNSVLFQNKSIVEHLCQMNGNTRYLRLAQVEAMGADIEAPCALVNHSNEPVMRLMEYAVERRDPEMVSYLLGKGCDPELESINPKTGQPFSAVTLSETLDPSSRDEIEPEMAARVKELIGFYMTRKAALDVISQLDKSPSP